MFRRLRWFVGLNQKNWSTKRLVNVEQQPGPARPNHLPVLDAVHEVAIYIHRFHNLDLFEQGWYKIKVTMRWEKGEDSYPGIPARVVQYEAPEVGSDNLCRVWTIDDTDNSFSTPPFRIKYARQDVFLSIMISFYLSFGECEGQSSAVILKFELMHAPIIESGPELQGSLDAYAASVHEFKIPPKALWGLHSYCPVHFDAFHAVLLDTSIHISLLKASYHTSRQKVSSDSREIPLLTIIVTYSSSDCHHNSNQVMLIKALLASYDILLEDLRRISAGIGKAIDLTEVAFESDATEWFTSTPPTCVKSVDVLRSFSKQKSAHYINNLTEKSIEPFSWDDHLLSSFQSLGNQLLCLWNIFLKFHRENKTKILEFLRKSWAIDRRTEWSIWMVYSKVAMPYQNMSNELDRMTFHFLQICYISFSSIQPIHIATMRAELHRRGISQMRASNCIFLELNLFYVNPMQINNRSLQDMYIFGDPLLVPIIIVERLTNVYHSASVNSNFIPLEDGGRLILENGSRATNKLCGTSPQQNEHVLRIVVFVHGFQAYDLTKCTPHHSIIENTLANFRNVLLLSSPQDGYVPYHSARIEPCPAASSDFSKRGKIFLEMLNNCLDQIRTHSEDRVVMRCDINFNTSSYGRNLNTLIGRTAHIEFLESDIFAKFIMWSFPELFRI
uniref:Protein FAM135B family n=1 Tax=Cajanus cajan TaxID=3821 RepID=A0A151RZA8_CAJCA|nr:Protein FAM135B family [Cajanus cajan]